MKIKALKHLLTTLVIASNIALAAPVQKLGEATGFKLLENLVLLVDRAGRQGGSVEDWNSAVLGLARELKSARDAKLVDALFAARYSRLLSAIRQALLSDPETLYWPMYRFTMVDFIEERTGQMPDWKRLLSAVNDHGGSGVGLAVIVEAVMNEVVSLHVHLESAKKRQGILETYLQKTRQARQAAQ